MHHNYGVVFVIRLAILQCCVACNVILRIYKATEWTLNHFFSFGDRMGIFQSRHEQENAAREILYLKNINRLSARTEIFFFFGPTAQIWALAYLHETRDSR
jgi:hypothetical protein